MRYLPLILKNCWRNRRRTLLTIASIGVSMCLLGVMMSMYHAFYLSAPAADEALRLVVRNRVSLTVAIPLAYQSRIQQIPGVREVMIGNWFGGTYKDNRDPKNMFARFSVEPEKLFRVYGEMRISDEEKKAFIRDRTGCVIGRDIANTHGFKVGDRIPLTGDIYPGDYEFTVRGIFDWPRSSDVMYINKEYVEQAMPERRRGMVGLYYILIDDPEHASRISSAVDAEFRNSTAETKTETEQAFTVGFLSLLGNVKMFLIAISGAVTFTILLVSANTMAMSVRERVREVGVLKTLGFAPGAILGLILGEAFSISMAGGLIGYLISTGLMRGIAKSPIGGFLPSLPPIEPVVAAACIGTAGIIGLLSSLVPALGASRMPIVEALELGLIAMQIPLSYNLRNLVVRKTTTLMTALGIALTVAVLLAILSLIDGLRNTLTISGNPLHVLVLRKGSDSELVSNFSRAQFQDLKFKPGIAAGRDGQPLASLEMITVINLANVDNPNGVNLTIRGLQPAGIELRGNVKMEEGRWFNAGQREIVVGHSVAKRFPDAQLGKTVHFARGEWKIVGVMNCGRCAHDSEIWGDLNQISSDYQRVEVLSSAIVQASDAVAAKAMINDINNDQRLGMHALSEQEFYELQTASGAPIEAIGIFVSIIMAVGSSFAAMNTMYAAVSRRAREIGTLRVLGFSRGSILTSFFVESVLLAGLGGVLGCLLVMPLNGITTAVGNANFAETAFDFHVTPKIMLVGIAFATTLGCAGGLFPARNAARKEILTALREV